MNTEHYIYVARQIQSLGNEYGQSFYSLLENYLNRGQDLSTAVFSVAKILTEHKESIGGKNG